MPDHPILPVLTKRWSGRAYADRDVDEATLNRLFEAARWAASSYNEQPWRFLVTRQGTRAFQRLLDTLFKGNRGWAANAPVLVATFAARYFQRNGQPNAHYWHDLGLAMGNLTLQATELGLNVHQMAGFERFQLAREFGVPDGFAPVTVAAIGYHGQPDDLPDPFGAMEEAAQVRLPLRDLVFRDTWPSEKDNTI
ncbi:MAG: nitroreductase family protein [Bacteroidota bacterium]